MFRRDDYLSSPCLYSKELNHDVNRCKPSKNPNRLPFYDWRDQSYQSFMIALLQKLEVRFFEPKYLIFYEMDDPCELYYIQEGCYDIGYEVNKRIKYRLKFGPRTVIGGFNVVFGVRHQFIIRSSTYLQGFSIRKKSWKSLVNQSPKFTKLMKIKLIQSYF